MNELVIRDGEKSQDVPKCPSSENRLNEPVAGDSSAPLTEQQHAAIKLLLLGKSLSAAAKALGIDRRTLYRWRQDELFRFELAQRRRELWSEAAERLSGMVHPALDILDEQLNDNYDRSRFRAAKTVLRLAALSRAIEAINAEE